MHSSSQAVAQLGLVVGIAICQLGRRSNRSVALVAASSSSWVFLAKRAPLVQLPSCHLSPFPVSRRRGPRRRSVPSDLSQLVPRAPHRVPVPVDPAGAHTHATGHALAASFSAWE